MANILAVFVFSNKAGPAPQAPPANAPLLAFLSEMSF